MSNSELGYQVPTFDIKGIFPKHSNLYKVDCKERAKVRYVNPDQQKKAGEMCQEEEKILCVPQINGSFQNVSVQENGYGCLIPFPTDENIDAVKEGRAVFLPNFRLIRSTAKLYELYLREKGMLKIGAEKERDRFLDLGLQGIRCRAKDWEKELASAKISSVLIEISDRLKNNAEPLGTNRLTERTIVTL